MKEALKHLTEDKNVFIDGKNKESGGKNDLIAIVRSAVELDAMLWQQKACFKFVDTCLWEKHGDRIWQYAPRWMDSDIEGSENNMLLTAEQEVVVDLFVAPALQKVGTTEGRNYEVELAEVVCKAWVECSLSEAQPTQH